MTTDHSQATLVPEVVGGARSDLASTPGTSIRERLNALVERLFAPVDSASIVVFRIAFGLIMAWEMVHYLRRDWVQAIYINPPFRFAYAGFGWLEPWPGNGMVYHFYALALLAMCIMLGYMYRIATVLFFVGFTYVFLLEKAHYLNHLYLVVLISFLLIFVPANRSFSLDAYLRPSLRSNTVPAWSLVMLVAQFSIIYIYGGFAKLNSDWLHGEPMRTWLAQETQFPVLGRWFTDEWMVYLVSYGGLLFDLFIVPLLLWPKTRWFAVAAMVVFHQFNGEIFTIGIFPWFATAAVFLFLPPDLPRRILRWFGFGKEPEEAGAETGRQVPPVPFSQRPRAQQLTIWLLAGYFAIQLLVPLRVYFYPGNPAWTDQGDRFAWRMMLHSKVGEVSYRVVDPASGESWVVDPSRYLTPLQDSSMRSQPDMIVQFSHYLADEWREEGYDNVEVYADTMISLNSRPRYPIVDPTVNLAAVQLSPMPADWITSLDEEEDRSGGWDVEP